LNAPNLIKVFVVEDSPVIRTALIQRLEDDSRFTVVGYADTAQGAIGALRHNVPDVLIVDLHLTQGTGYDILAYLRNTGPPPGLNTIVMTNYASSAHRHRALELGAGSFFDKSMQFDDMLDALRIWADEKDSKNRPVPAQ
jgi:DNA-binding NarL/FixJ family response regulator